MSENTWHSMSLVNISKELKVDFEKGLSKKEAAERRASFGLNTLPKGKKKRWWYLLFNQFKNPLIFILLMAAGITFWLDTYTDTAVIMVSVSVNVIIGFWQEFRSNKIFEKLEKLVTTMARVRRNGKLEELDAGNLVPGDIILISAGMKVPADARIISQVDLEVTEALLTGESDPVKKDTKDLAEDTVLADRTNMIFMGTVVEKGEAEAVVVGTGAKTELGKIAKLTANVKDEKTPLQERLGVLTRRISLMVAFFAAMILFAGYFSENNFAVLFTLAVAVAVAAIPEGLPAAFAVALAVASQRILKKKGLVKTLIGAETLGSTTVICTDKTGTLTEGKMEVENIFHFTDKKRIELALAFANEAKIVGAGKISGEATDRAKMEFYRKAGGDLEKDLDELPRCALLPFDPHEKYIASFHKYKDGSINIFVTGAPETVFGFSSMPKEEYEHISGEVDQLASEGFRIIAAAELRIEDSSRINCKDRNDLKKYISDLNFLGIAAIRDPIRSDVKESIKQVREAGLRVIMITGDHKLTARAIAGELGFNMEKETCIVEGAELEKMSKKELKERIKEIEIVSRATPSHKMYIIEALRANKEVIAMTGDGVNDAPALKDADIGIALGSGTDVTKEASDLVLLDDSFSTIVSAVREGRIAFTNIRKVTIFLITNAFTETILILTSILLRLPFTAITAAQILWANLMEDGLPGSSLAFEPGEKGIMKLRPYKRNEAIINKLGWRIIIIVGVLSDLVLVGLFLWLVYLTDLEPKYIQTVMFAALATDTLIYIFSIKTLSFSAFSRNAFNNKYLLLGVAVGFIMMFSSVYLPVLNTFLGTVPLSFLGIALVFSSGIIRLLMVETLKWWMRKKERIKNGNSPSPQLSVVK
ncbi:MAG: HAD-IC family P-type ATPase [Candidatus Spechtbacterales bacterium]